MPLSEVDSESFLTFLEEEKVALNTVEVDIRDARRRINLAKGPKRRTPADAEPEDASASGDDASGED